jgi:hypothetical protein
MAYLSTTTHAPITAIAPGIAALQRAMLWLVGASGGIVFIEPSPYEVRLLLALVVFTVTGLKLRPVFMVLIGLLAVINLGYSISAANLMGESTVVNWILTSWYMAVGAVFFALVLSDDTEKRFSFLARGYVAGAVVASLAGIAGYFNLVPGAYDLLTFGFRARGTFKDPNVLGAFLIFPALICLQGMVIERAGKAIRSAVAFGIISFAIFLAFSRGAWGMLVVSSVLMLFLMFVTAPTQGRRLRIVALAIAAIVCVALMIIILLSFGSTSALLEERASLHQSYDSGRFGRFGRHVLGAAMALDVPLGIGPLQFSKYFPEDTHNSFLNAFMSGGWLSGLFYPVLIFTTLGFGFRALLHRTPWQQGYFALFSAFLVTVGESFIIDTDHWRHFFLMMGAVWGMFVAGREWRDSAFSREADAGSR